MNCEKNQTPFCKCEICCPHLPPARDEVKYFIKDIEGRTVQVPKFISDAVKAADTSKAFKEFCATPSPLDISAPNKYQREIKPGVFVDVYDVLKAFNVTCPAMAHGVKKCLAPGQRGVKNSTQDKNEAIASIKRSIEMESPDKDEKAREVLERNGIDNDIISPKIYEDSEVDRVFAGVFEGRDLYVTPEVKRVIEYLQGQIKYLRGDQ